VNVIAARAKRLDTQRAASLARTVTRSAAAPRYAATCSSSTCHVSTCPRARRRIASAIDVEDSTDVHAGDETLRDAARQNVSVIVDR